jgi:hypothetical protein
VGLQADGTHAGCLGVARELDRVLDARIEIRTVVDVDVDRTLQELEIGTLGQLGHRNLASIEYDYIDFSDERITLAAVPSVTPATRAFDVRQTVSLVKVGINYRFGGW